MNEKARRETIDHALARLHEIAREHAKSAPWQAKIKAAHEARNDPDWEKRTRLTVEALKAVRDAGALDQIEAQILIAGSIVALAEHRATGEPVPQMRALLRRMREIEADSGLSENDFWSEESAVPDEWLKLSRDYEEIWDGILAATFNQFGEANLGVSYLANTGRGDDPYGPARRRRTGE